MNTDYSRYKYNMQIMTFNDLCNRLTDLLYFDLNKYPFTTLYETFMHKFRYDTRNSNNKLCINIIYKVKESKCCL